MSLTREYVAPVSLVELVEEGPQEGLIDGAGPVEGDHAAAAEDTGDNRMLYRSHKS